MLCRAFIVSALVTLLFCDAWAFRRLDVGDLVDDFTLVNFDGGIVRLSDSMGRKATAVIFWATWNPRSAEALGDFQRLHDSASADDFRVVAVNVEHEVWEPGEFEKVAAYVGRNNLTFPVVVDVEFTLYERYGVTVLPSIVLIDPQGRVINQLSGYPASPTRSEFIKAVLAVIQPQVAAGSPQSLN
jgi:peroxiredoxin